MRLGDKISIIYLGVLLAIVPILSIVLSIDSDYSFFEYIDDYGIASVIGESIGFAIIPFLLPWGLYRYFRKSIKKESPIQ